MTPPATLQSGTVIAGRWRISASLGRGDMGQVCEVRDAAGGRTCALKLFDPAFSQQRQAWESFQQTARLANALATPAVVQVYEFGADSALGRPYIVSERIAWPSLDRALSAGPLSPTQLSALLATVGPALAAVHEAGIVHRDLKPQNIFISASDPGAARVSDFGVSILRAAAPPAPGWGGTPGWIGPDAAEPKSASTLAMDVYSLGLICFYALTGRSAFGDLERLASDPQQLWNQMIQPIGSAAERASELGVHLSGELDKWFSRALAPHPKGRFGSINEMLSAYALAVDAAARDNAAQLAVQAARALEPPAQQARSATTPRYATPAPAPAVEEVPEPSGIHAPYSGAAPPGIAAASAQPIALMPSLPPPRKKKAKPPKRAEAEADANAPRQSSTSAILVLVVGSLVCLAAVALVVFLYMSEERRITALAERGAAMNSRAPAPPPQTETGTPGSTTQPGTVAVPPAAPPHSAPTPAAGADSVADGRESAPPSQPLPDPVASGPLVSFSCLPPPCDSVWCDGAPIAIFHRPVRLEPGKHTCKALKAGHRTQAQAFTLGPDEHQKRIFHQTKQTKGGKYIPPEL